MEKGCRKGARVRVWAALCHVVVAAASGLGLFFRVGGTAQRAKPGSASAAWRLLTARGRHLSHLLVWVSKPALRRLGAAGKVIYLQGIGDSKRWECKATWHIY